LLRIAGVLRIALPHPIAQRLDWVMVLAERLHDSNRGVYKAN